MKKVYVVYLDDGHNCFKLHVPAENERKAKEFVKGNGEIISIKRGERTVNDPISLDYISNALSSACFGQEEIDLIIRALGDCEFIV